ncbi:MAG: thioredoxin family protein [Planctomycetes bacterium]|nr:thioredoxin family protein [Planctomycetota bacterium]
MTRCVRFIVILSLAALLGGTGSRFVAAASEELSLPGLGSGAGVTGRAAAPEVGVELLANQTAVAPGGTVDLAIRFKVPSGWHVYWQNRGEGGQETRFEWKLPPGWSVGPMRFPPPSRHVDELETHTFILENEPVMLTTARAPKDVKPGQEATIGLEAEWLVCQKLCFQGRKSLSVSLPVVASAEAVKPAHEDDFEDARRRLPVAADKAKHLTSVKAVANVDKAEPGATLAIAVVFEVEAQHHVNSHQPLQPGLIATDVFHERTKGVEIGRAIFPAGTVVEMLGEKLSVHRGRTAVFLPVHVDGDLAAKELRFAGVLTYQACSDKTGTCYQPTSVEWSVTLPVAAAGETLNAANADVFRDMPTTEGGGETREAASGKGRGFTLHSEVRATTVQKHHSLVVWLGLALLAGLILNITPCVLPVISIKVLSFVQQASESPGRVCKLGLAFSLGMMVVFNVLAIMATGLGLVWGQHFQSPAFTIAMASVVFAFGLSMFGVFTLAVPQAVGTLAGRAEGEGYAGSVAKVALATVMGTPCLGPFLGPVLVWAAGQPASIVFLAFNTIGIGMALPYVLLTANPRWLRFVPKAGPWLTTFKQAMAFLLMGTVVYLLYILEGQLGGPAVIRTLVFATALALACWLVGRFITYNTPPGARLGWYAVALGVAAGVGFISFGRGMDWNATAATVVKGGHASPSGQELPWVPFSLEKLAEVTGQGKTVLLDITARWCPNCQYNSAAVFNTPEMAAVVAKYDVVPMLADWTARDKATGDLIEKLASGASIPLAAIFPGGRPNEPIVMLGIVTRQQVIDNLAQAAGR